MSAPAPLKGIELIDCAKANAKQGIETASQLCGYGSDLNTFKQELQQACRDIGVEVTELSDLVTDQYVVSLNKGIEVAPDTPGEL